MFSDGGTRMINQLFSSRNLSYRWPEGIPETKKIIIDTDYEFSDGMLSKGYILN